MGYSSWPIFINAVIPRASHTLRAPSKGEKGRKIAFFFAIRCAAAVLRRATEDCRFADVSSRPCSSSSSTLESFEARVTPARASIHYRILSSEEESIRLGVAVSERTREEK